MEAIFQALPMLGDVAVLAAFYFAIAGIACVEMFKGKFYNRCAVPDFGTSTADGSMVVSVSSCLVLPLMLNSHILP